LCLAVGDGDRDCGLITQPGGVTDLVREGVNNFEVASVIVNVIVVDAIVNGVLWRNENSKRALIQRVGTFEIVLQNLEGPIFTRPIDCVSD